MSADSLQEAEETLTNLGKRILRIAKFNHNDPTELHGSPLQKMQHLKQVRIQYTSAIISCDNIIKEAEAILDDLSIRRHDNVIKMLQSKTASTDEQWSTFKLILVLMDETLNVIIKAKDSIKRFTIEIKQIQTMLNQPLP